MTWSKDQEIMGGQLWSTMSDVRKAQEENENMRTRMEALEKRVEQLELLLSNLTRP
jgi:predicted  nucleic acid-binding Zn-ribbon protein